MKRNGGFKTCLGCKRIFYSKLSHFKRRKYCSKHCAMKNRTDIRIRKERVKMECKYCKNIFEILKSQSKNRKFCSKNCYTNWMGPQIKKACLICNEEFCVKPAYIKNGEGKFCSRKCYAIWQSENQKGEHNLSWQGGRSREPYGWDFSLEIKEKIRKRDEYRCQNCNRKENGKAHFIHHIDYDKKNNKEANLITLCHSCHSKTNHNRKYWKNYFYKNPQNQFLNLGGKHEGNHTKV